MDQIFNIVRLLHKRKLQNLSETERVELEKWLNEDGNYNFLECIVSEERELIVLEELSHYDVDMAYKEFTAKRKKDGRKIFSVWMKVAAVVTVVLGITALLLSRTSLDGHDNVPANNVSPILSGGSKAILKLESGEQIILGDEQQYVHLDVDHCVDLVADSSGLCYNKYDKIQDDELSYNEIYVPRKGEYTLRLSDGSKVYLNADTRLKFPVVFSQNERRVELEGEAYFEIVKDTLAPFIVTAGDVDVRVLGTAFNVKAYKGEQRILTTLVSGKVRLKQGIETLDIKPDEQVSCHREHPESIQKKNVNALLYCGWKDGLLKFERERLEDITMILGRWYDMEFFFENSQLKDYLFTGDLKKYDNMEVHLNMLEMTTNIQFAIKGNTVLVRCK